MKLSTEQLVSIIKSHRANSLGADDGELSTDRATALDHYYGRPYGDERDGRSGIVSKDLAATVDWIMPAVMKVFVGSGDIVEFIPESQEDEAKAKQESEATNHVIMKDNEGYIVVHDAVKDALLLKAGYFKHYWDEAIEQKEEEYEGLLDVELMQLLSTLEQSGEVDILAQDTEEVEINGEVITLYSVKVRITITKGRCAVEAVPVEEVRVSKSCRGSLQSSPFTEHVTKKRRYELIEMGMDEGFVAELPSYSSEGDDDAVVHSRNSVSDETDDLTGTSFDRSMDEIEYCEAYIRVDWDGDGIAELRKVVTVADRIPDGDEWNEVIDAVPLTGMVMKRVPHRHVGESIDDEIEDLQRIKTVLQRQLMDNSYIANNQELIINERANVADFMRRVPGGLKRVSGEGPVSDAVQTVPVTPIIQQILPVIDYIDGIKADRTGIDKSTTGVDADLLKKTTGGAYMESLNRASQKVEMIIRTLAETGIKELVKQVHKILLTHQDKPRTLKLGGKYETVNPREWKERTSLTVKVGIGSGSQEERREKYMLMYQLQEGLLGVGAAAPWHRVNLFNDLAKLMDFDIPEKYAFTPEQIAESMQQQSQQQQPNPLAEVEHVKGQYQMQIAQLREQAKQQMEQMKEYYKQQLEMVKGDKEEMQRMRELQHDMMKHLADIASKEDIAAFNGEIKALIEGYKVDAGKPGIGAGLQERTFDPSTGTFL